MRIGLKLWSTNTQYYLDEAKRLFCNNCFDYIELFVVPASTNTVTQWQKLKYECGLPFTLHAPHCTVGVNLADKTKQASNVAAYEDVAAFNIALQPQYTVVHAGFNGDIQETIRQLNIIQPKNILIENKPYKLAYNDSIGRCATLEEIQAVLDSYEAGFCLDIAHAICAANALGKEPYGYLAELNKLAPRCYHISGNFIDSATDRHMHLGQGSYDWHRIFDIIDTDKDITLETPKDSKENLEDFIPDVKLLNSICSR